MQPVKSSKLPLQSALHDRIKPMDFVDCYCIDSNFSPRDAAEIVTHFPTWAQLLVRIRNVITAPLGLLQEAPTTGDEVGFFPVESETTNELIMGFNDKHLNFRVSVMSQNGKIFLATWVHTNNKVGKLYLKVILPFHILIVRNALARLRKASIQRDL